MANENLDIALGDFGSSFQVQQIPKTTELVSRHYRSPEIITGGSVGVETDLWAIGICLVELATGKRVFDGTDVNAMIIRFLEFGRVFPSGLVRKSKLLRELLEIEESMDGNWNGLLVLEMQKKFQKNSIEQFLKRHLEEKESIKDLTVFMDLIDKILQIDPNERIKAKNALVHAFFKHKN